MNAAVHINGHNVSNHTISYERQHKICTGVGQIQVTVARGSGLSSNDLNPWKEIKIYENGSWVATYYINQIDDTNPDGSVKIYGQDNSKRLVDYFIAESYTVDSPTTTKYWIEKFLKMAKVPYKFETPSEGFLLSNNTTLGLSPAYDQIVYLLQISGWYMHFKKNGKCIIGKLNTDLTHPTDSFSDSEITKIQVTKHDKMLRNKVLVWGKQVGYSGSSIWAESHTITPYNYDKKDLRTMVISNSNIPTAGIAKDISKKALKEFARITIEKSFTVDRAVDLEVGDVVWLRSRAWRGKGLVTTYGTSMSRDGLVTNIILDERCPRLFAYFDFGDYVYIGTAGSGIWRKHIQFDDTWEPYSSGLNDLSIKDLHVNNGVLGCVTHSGECYVSNEEDGYWNPVVLSGLTILDENRNKIGTYDGSVKGRAVIVDRDDNTVKFAVDTGFWNNYLFYPNPFTISGLFDGAVVSGFDTKSWIVNVTSSGEYIKDYPVIITSGLTLSGVSNFDGTSSSYGYNAIISGIFLLDMEESGDYDFVSGGVSTSGGVFITPNGYGIGEETFLQDSVTQLSNVSYSGSYLSIPYSGYDVNGIWQHAMSLIDQPYEKAIAFCHTNYNISSNILLTAKIYNPDINNFYEISSRVIDTGIAALNVNILHLCQLPDGYYRFLHRKIVSGIYNYYITTVNIYTGSVVTNDITSSFPTRYHAWMYERFISVGKKTYIGISTTVNSGNYSDWIVYISVVDLQTGTVSNNTFWTGGNITNGTRTLYDHPTNAPYFYQKDYQDGVRCYVGIRQWTGFTTVGGVLYGTYILYGLFGTTVPDTSLPFSSYDGNDYKMDLTTAPVNYPNWVGGQIFEDVIETLNFRRTNLYLGFIGVKDYPTSSPYEFLISDNYIDRINKTDDLLNKDRVYPVYGNGFVYISEMDSAGNFRLFDFPDITTPVTTYTLPYPYNTIKGMPFAILDNYTGLQFTEVLFSGNQVGIVGFNPYNGFVSYDLGTRRSSSGRGLDTTHSFINSENVGNIFVSRGTNTSNTGDSTGGGLMDANIIFLGHKGEMEFFIAQRNNDDFLIIESGNLPFRIDVSNINPLTSLQTTESTFENFYFGTEEITVVSTISGVSHLGMFPSGSFVNDYRYTDLSLSGIISSGIYPTDGINIDRRLIYVLDEKINSKVLDDFSDPQVIWSHSSLRMLETTNYQFDGQYIFVSTSGFVIDSGVFFQKDNDSVEFRDVSSGIPLSEITIIRVNDMV